MLGLPITLKGSERLYYINHFVEFAHARSIFLNRGTTYKAN